MQTIHSFLSRIDPRLVDRVIPHREGYVSDLLFAGFDRTLALLLPIPTSSGWISWSDIADQREKSMTASTSLSDLFFPEPVSSLIYFAHGTIYDPGYIERLSRVLALGDGLGEWAAAYWGGYADFSSQADIIAPDDSFLRPEPYAIVEQSLPQWVEYVADLGRLPSILTSPNLHFIATQPIYADRIYVSCTSPLADHLIESLPDVHPVSPDSPLACA
ncbi:hypothetical protein [Trueperella pecoris]|uniref:hypothetical protein n=1 Tax=Trueperella pecoris TaxID=2733571 RepID=UPI001ABE8995|nr:hypothetical protein [Trueperella pecoris]QTG76144.1 hypothetical protein J4179_03615 [Trueperella pecoris]